MRDHWLVDRPSSAFSPRLLEFVNEPIVEKVDSLSGLQYSAMHASFNHHLSQKGHRVLCTTPTAPRPRTSRHPPPGWSPRRSMRIRWEREKPGGSSPPLIFKTA